MYIAYLNKILLLLIKKITFNMKKNFYLSKQDEKEFPKQWFTFFLLKLALLTLCDITISTCALF